MFLLPLQLEASAALLLAMLGVLAHRMLERSDEARDL
jgi:hypothetical protein